MLVVGKDRFKDVDIRVRVNGGGHVAQIYAIRQAIAKAIVSFFFVRFTYFLNMVQNYLVYLLTKD